MESLNKPLHYIPFAEEKIYILPAWFLTVATDASERNGVYIVVTIFIVVTLMLKYNELKIFNCYVFLTAYKNLVTVETA